jgi:hypothetical protein
MAANVPRRNGPFSGLQIVGIGLRGAIVGGIVSIPYGGWSILRSSSNVTETAANISLTSIATSVLSPTTMPDGCASPISCIEDILNHGRGNGSYSTAGLREPAPLGKSSLLTKMQAFFLLILGLFSVDQSSLPFDSTLDNWYKITFLMSTTWSTMMNIWSMAILLWSLVKWLQMLFQPHPAQPAQPVEPAAADVNPLDSLAPEALAILKDIQKAMNGVKKKVNKMNTTHMINMKKSRMVEKYQSHSIKNLAKQLNIFKKSVDQSGNSTAPKF